MKERKNEKWKNIIIMKLRTVAKSKKNIKGAWRKKEGNEEQRQVGKRENHSSSRWG